MLYLGGDGSYELEVRVPSALRVPWQLRLGHDSYSIRTGTTARALLQSVGPCVPMGYESSVPCNMGPFTMGTQFYLCVAVHGGCRCAEVRVLPRVVT